MTLEQFIAEHRSLKVIIRNTEDCWVWIGPRHSDGSGYMLETNSAVVGPRHLTVHKWMWDVTHPDDQLTSREVISQTCGNKACCNPLHLQKRQRKEWSRHVVQRDKSTPEL